MTTIDPKAANDQFDAAQTRLSDSIRTCADNLREVMTLLGTVAPRDVERLFPADDREDAKATLADAQKAIDEWSAASDQAINAIHALARAGAIPAPTVAP